MIQRGHLSENSVGGTVIASSTVGRRALDLADVRIWLEGILTANSFK